MIIRHSKNIFHTRTSILTNFNIQKNSINLKRILGISAFYHDSAAAITVGGKTIAAAQEERFTRDKHTPDFSTNAIFMS